jgi:DNA-binding transcriptional MerR regulator
MASKARRKLMSGTAVFPIGYVSITTGLSTHVLRAWERRYGVVHPKRTASGRRLYSQEDIDRLSLLKQAVSVGHSISRIAGLDELALAGLISSHIDYSSISPPDNKFLASDASSIPQIIAACLLATERFDDSGLNDILTRASLTQSRQTIIDSIIVPFMEQVGSRWLQGRMRIANEHLASTVVASYLNSQLYPHHGAALADRRILIATPAGQFCHLGAMATAVTVRAHGWQPVFLGSNLPSEEIAAACLSLSPKLIALSITCCVDERLIESEIIRLVTLLDDRYPLFVGGRGSATLREMIEQAGGAVCHSARQLAERLQ